MLHFRLQTKPNSFLSSVQASGIFLIFHRLYCANGHISVLNIASYQNFVWIIQLRNSFLYVF